MPVKPPRICGCGHRIASGARCPCEAQRARQAQARNDQRRGSAHQRGYTKDWDREAKAFLSLPVNRRCVLCGAPADTVDHKVAHKGNQRLFWDRSNWQPVCRPCNSRKNVRTEGGFGKPFNATRCDMHYCSTKCQKGAWQKRTRARERAAQRSAFICDRAAGEQGDAGRRRSVENYEVRSASIPIELRGKLSKCVEGI